MMSRRIVLPMSLLFVFFGLSFAVVMSVNNFFVYFGELLGIGSRTTSGDYVVVQSIGRSVGTEKLSGGDYTVSSSVGVLAAGK